MNNEYCVYKITNKLNGKIYIGMTKNLKSRWRNNGIAYKPNNHKSSFYNAIQKYGWDNFYKEILNSSLSFEEATKLEKEYIKLYNARDNSKGYNIAEGGNGGILYLTHPKGFLNKKHTDEWKNEHSKRMTGVNNPFYNKKHDVHPKGFLNKEHTKESKNKTSKTMKEKGVNKKKVKSISPNGDVKIFSSVSECCNYYFNRNTSDVIYRLLKNGKQYEINKNTNKNLIPILKNIVGFRFEYL